MKAESYRLAAAAYALAAAREWPTLSAVQQRARVVEWAADVGVHLGPHDHPQWCGLFAFAQDKRAGLLVPPWVLGTGIIDWRTWRTTDRPLPGDVGYKPHPWGHHMLVTAVLREDGSLVQTVEGNTPGVTVHEHPVDQPGVLWYSVNHLIPPDVAA